MKRMTPIAKPIDDAFLSQHVFLKILGGRSMRRTSSWHRAFCNAPVNSHWLSGIGYASGLLQLDAGVVIRWKGQVPGSK
jgi:hypothetical protein